jgi:hypothetical protein
MTVAELIKILEECPDKELPVYFMTESISGYLSPTDKSTRCDHKFNGPCGEDCDGLTIVCDYL